ncbi:MAG: glycosyltransferase, partial [Candidatus Dechloromonas phosphoritropha]
SNTILEAMASGLPVIATDVGGNADLVSAGITGQLVTAGDSEALARQIIQLANNPDRAWRMGQLGRQRVEEKFSMNAMVAAYLGTYDKLLGRSAMAA